MAGIPTAIGKAIGALLGNGKQKAKSKMASAKLPPGLKNSAKNRAAVNKSNKTLGLKGKAASPNRSSTTGKKLGGNTPKQKAARRAGTKAAKNRVTKSAPKAAAAKKAAIANRGGKGQKKLNATSRKRSAQTAKNARVGGGSG